MTTPRKTLFRAYMEAQLERPVEHQQCKHAARLAASQTELPLDDGMPERVAGKIIQQEMRERV